MPARRRIYRARTKPSGFDYADVLKRAKVAFRSDGEFEIWAYPTTDPNRPLWSADTVTVAPFVPHPTSKYYRFNPYRGRWELLPSNPYT